MKSELRHPLAFVPTMGALHAGHQSLIKIAKQKCDEVVLSVFVNPLQFENKEDLAQYPRNIDGDIALAQSTGATFVWAPTFEEVYPGDPVIIPAGKIGNLFEGVHRFGHFDGVLTVVHRLFELIRPEYAIFGEKDFQQLFLINQMVRELELPIEIISAPIVREDDGLAMSSRNIRLSTDDRARATIIYKALCEANGSKDPARALQRVLSKEKNFQIDYAEIIDANTFEVATVATPNKRAIVAGWLSGVRLIDNMAMEMAMESSGALA
jgi:pantoate--beta-alanine ligase